MTQPSIPESIFNIHKSDYKSTDLFLEDRKRHV